MKSSRAWWWVFFRLSLAVAPVLGAGLWLLNAAPSVSQRMAFRDTRAPNTDPRIYADRVWWDGWPCAGVDYIFKSEEEHAAAENADPELRSRATAARLNQLAAAGLMIAVMAFCEWLQRRRFRLSLLTLLLLSLSIAGLLGLNLRPARVVRESTSKKEIAPGQFQERRHVFIVGPGWPTPFFSRVHFGPNTTAEGALASVNRSAHYDKAAVADDIAVGLTFLALLTLGTEWLQARRQRKRGDASSESAARVSSGD